MIAFEADIHAVAGLLKRYFRELPDPLFTNELYTSFVQGLGKSFHISVVGTLTKIHLPSILLVRVFCRLSDCS